jgi:hypothetical protein
MCKKKKLGVCWGLVDKISPAFELRNPGVPAVGRQVRIPASLYEVSTDKPASISNQAGHRAPLTYLCVAPPGQYPAYTLYLPKTALAALAGLYPFPVTGLPSSPAYTLYALPKTALAALANLQSEDLTL